MKTDHTKVFACPSCGKPIAKALVVGGFSTCHHCGGVLPSLAELETQNANAATGGKWSGTKRDHADNRESSSGEGFDAIEAYRRRASASSQGLDLASLKAYEQTRRPTSESGIVGSSPQWQEPQGGPLPATPDLENSATGFTPESVKAATLMAANTPGLAVPIKAFPQPGLAAAPGPWPAGATWPAQPDLHPPGLPVVMMPPAMMPPAASVNPMTVPMAPMVMEPPVAAPAAGGLFAMPQGSVTQGAARNTPSYSPASFGPRAVRPGGRGATNSWLLPLAVLVTFALTLATVVVVLMRRSS